jgi:hypothetical protein
MEGLNIITLLYLFFRLAPFIIICYFSLSSLFNLDIKGLIYLAGLMLACVIGIIAGSLCYEIPEEKKPVCDMITIGNNGSFSKIPIGIIMLSYTFCYLLFIMMQYTITTSQIPTIILFSILIAGDIVWNYTNNRYYGSNIIVSLVVGGGFGWLWGMVIHSIGIPNLLYLNVGSDKTVCSRPSKQLFKCTFSQKLEATINIGETQDINGLDNATAGGGYQLNITGGVGRISINDTFNFGNADPNNEMYVIIGTNGTTNNLVLSESMTDTYLNIMPKPNNVDTTKFDPTKVKIYNSEHFTTMEGFSNSIKEGYNGIGLAGDVIDNKVIKQCDNAGISGVSGTGGGVSSIGSSVSGTGDVVSSTVNNLSELSTGSDYSSIYSTMLQELPTSRPPKMDDMSIINKAMMNSLDQLGPDASLSEILSVQSNNLQAQTNANLLSVLYNENNQTTLTPIATQPNK